MVTPISYLLSPLLSYSYWSPVTRAVNTKKPSLSSVVDVATTPGGPKPALSPHLSLRYFKVPSTSPHHAWTQSLQDGELGAHEADNEILQMWIDLFADRHAHAAVSWICSSPSNWCFARSKKELVNTNVPGELMKCFTWNILNGSREWPRSHHHPHS